MRQAVSEKREVTPSLAEQRLSFRLPTPLRAEPRAVESPDPALWFREHAHAARFGAFLRTIRGRIPPATPALGSWRRLPGRCGRRVTQEEVAEAAGVSRNWYRALESGSGARASMKLLDRLATVFGFTVEERTELFVLAIPEMAYLREHS